jgi:hypothetical protein
MKKFKQDFRKALKKENSENNETEPEFGKFSFTISN